jgi:predicted ribosome quality control (RQC) complex YloA/Tae2 family protein
MKSISRFIDSLGINIEFIIGGNAQENHDIIDEAYEAYEANNENDLWFHISDMPSAHVISKIPKDLELKKDEIKKIIKQGALICKTYSKYKKEKNVSIDYTRIKNVEKCEEPGAVTLKEVKKIII